MSQSNVFCNVKIGINKCDICYNEAFFSPKMPQEKHDTLCVMQLFKCGHGMCNNCFEAMKKTKKDFACPFCRYSDVTRIVNLDYAVSLSLDARGVINNKNVQSFTKEIYTYEDFLEEFEDKIHLLRYSNHHFMIIYRQMIYNEEISLSNKIKKKEEDIKKKILNDKKRERKVSRKLAVCKICNKNTFTSEKQLNIHIKAKHINK